MIKGMSINMWFSMKGTSNYPLQEIPFWLIFNSATRADQRRTFPPIRSVSAVIAAQNTPIVKRMFRQGPDHISACCSPQPVSSGWIPGAAFHRWPVWEEGGRPGRLCMERGHDRLPELSHTASNWLSIHLQQRDKQETSPTWHTSLKPLTFLQTTSTRWMCSNKGWHK